MKGSARDPVTGALLRDAAFESFAGSLGLDGNAVWLLRRGFQAGWAESAVLTETDAAILAAERDLARAERDLLLFLMRREDDRPPPVSIEQAEERVALAREILERLRGKPK